MSSRVGPLRDPSALAELTFRERIWLHNGDDYEADVDRVIWQMETFDTWAAPMDLRVAAEADFHIRAKNQALPANDSIPRSEPSDG